jgi:hypothetical protein
MSNIDFSLITGLLLLITLPVLNISIYLIVESLIIELVNKRINKVDENNKRNLRNYFYIFLIFLVISIPLFLLQQDSFVYFLLESLNLMNTLIILYIFYLIIKTFYLVIKKKVEVKMELLKIIVFSIIVFIVIVITNYFLLNFGL